jgi:hypothetical protein
MVKQLIVGVLFVATASSASALVLCTTPDGKTYAGDVPPPNCVVKQKLENAPARTNTPPTPPGAKKPSSEALQRSTLDDRTKKAKEHVETLLRLFPPEAPEHTLIQECTQRNEPDWLRIEACAEEEVRKYQASRRIP